MQIVLMCACFNPLEFEVLFIFINIEEINRKFKITIKLLFNVSIFFAGEDSFFESMAYYLINGICPLREEVDKH
jgi:hypothetical protein